VHGRESRCCKREAKGQGGVRLIKSAMESYISARSWLLARDVGRSQEASTTAEPKMEGTSPALTAECRGRKYVMRT
jgi:hypothetical protein